MTRIAAGQRVGHAAWSCAYAIGFMTCRACRTETPEPPQKILDDLAAKQSTISTVWPFEHWQVPGWIDIHDYGHICDRCARAVMSLLSARRTRESNPSDGDMTLLEVTVHRAIELADEGLLAAFPPPSRPYEEGSCGDGYRYQHPTKSYVYRTLEDYRAGMLRDQIRQIRAALQGRDLSDED